MSLPSINPTSTRSWELLKEHFKNIKDVHMLDWFKDQEGRTDQLTIKFDDFLVDYSKNRITPKTVSLLCDLADEIKLKDAIESFFNGDIINKTENRSVSHTALRADTSKDIFVNKKNVASEISSVKHKIKEFSADIIDGNRKGYTGKAFKTIVNIGIGGSDLGPAMVVDALTYYGNRLTTYFISNVDGDHVHETLNKLDPETTLFVIVSKTFTTQETLSNATTARKWFLKSAEKDDIKYHFVAVSTNIEKVVDFGIDSSNIFPMWDWVGGRFSLWSAVGLSISLSIGYGNFEKLLLGANKMDNHFRNSEFKNNIPVVLALISIWYNNFFKAQTQAIIPYSQYLNQFATYLQQAIMESNGKSVDRNGEPIHYETGTIIWGEPGTNSQHAFFQLIHQGTKLIPTDFIGFAESLHQDKGHHDKLMSNFFAQTEALLSGKSETMVIKEMGDKENKVIPFKVFDGNKPTNTILIDKLTPESLGKLIAMYEHKIFVEGIVWNIYSFDQFGVELGKQLANSILDEIDSKELKYAHDSSTNRLLNHYLDRSN